MSSFACHLLISKCCRRSCYIYIRTYIKEKASLRYTNNTSVICNRFVYLKFTFPIHCYSQIKYKRCICVCCMVISYLPHFTKRLLKITFCNLHPYFDFLLKRLHKKTVYFFAVSILYPPYSKDQIFRTILMDLFVFPVFLPHRSLVGTEAQLFTYSLS